MLGLQFVLPHDILGRINNDVGMASKVPFSRQFLMIILTVIFGINLVSISSCSRMSICCLMVNKDSIFT